MESKCDFSYGTLTYGFLRKVDFVLLKLKWNLFYYCVFISPVTVARYCEASTPNIPLEGLNQGVYEVGWPYRWMGQWLVDHILSKATLKASIIYRKSIRSSEGFRGLFKHKLSFIRGKSVEVLSLETVVLFSNLEGIRWHVFKVWAEGSPMKWGWA